VAGSSKNPGPLGLFAIFWVRAEFNRFGEMGEGDYRGRGGCFKIIMAILGNNFEHVSMVWWILVKIYVKFHENHVKIHENSCKKFMNFHGNRNGNQWKVYKKLGIPKENIPEMIHSTKRFGYQKSQNVWSIEFLPENFWFLKNLVKILIKMLG
jgi:hypothetical protein